MNASQTLRPLSDWPLAERQGIRGVMTDIDDTLTTAGAITPEALAALADLRASGVPVVAITGRPVGWSTAFAATWPVAAVVAENGAVALIPESVNGLRPFKQADTLLSKLYQQDATTRTTNFVRMQAIAQRVLAQVPGTTLAQDSPGRETDIAIDHSEFADLDEATVAQVVALLRAAGMTVTVSSIHINAWFGDHTKLSGARWMVRELYGRHLDDELNRWVYVGDSTNDQLMFQHFPHSVGVANVHRFQAQLTHLPRYVTPSERGAGFAEVARSVLEGRLT